MNRFAACVPHPEILRAAAVGLLLTLVGAEQAGAVTYYATYKLNGGTQALVDQSYSASGTDTSGVWVLNSGTLTLTDSDITTSGNTSSQDNSSFYGLNAGVLTTSGTIILSNCTVDTTGTGANGIFATGAGTSIYMSNGSIAATADGGHGAMATRGGALTLANVAITTAGENAAAIATDRGGGTITVTGGTATTAGTDSPGIYSTGAITVLGATITASGAEAAVIEGANSITLTNTALSSTFADKWGVLIYQSTSGDADGTTGTFTMTGGSLSSAGTEDPLFFVTNAKGIIKLTGVTVTAASGILIEAGATTKWGTSGANGGTVEFTADSETLAGNIVTADSISSIKVTLKNGSALTGAIDEAALVMDEDSTWTLTGTSHVTTISNDDGISGLTVSNIVGNGYNVYYDSSLSANSGLGGKSYALVNGGLLMPSSGSDLGDAIVSGLCGTGLMSLAPVAVFGLGIMAWRRRR